jgi:hypothetical protein
MQNDHLQESFSGKKPTAVNGRKKFMAFHGIFIFVEVDVESLEHFHKLWFVVVHDCAGKLDGRLQNKLAEGSFEWFSIFTNRLSDERFGRGMKEALTPKVWHELLDSDSELAGVLSESGVGAPSSSETTISSARWSTLSEKN